MVRTSQMWLSSSVLTAISKGAQKLLFNNELDGVIFVQLFPPSVVLKSFFAPNQSSYSTAYITSGLFHDSSIAVTLPVPKVSSKLKVAPLSLDTQTPLPLPM